MSSADSFDSLRSQNETLLRQLKEKQEKIYQQLTVFKRSVKGSTPSAPSIPAKKPEKAKKPKKSSEKKRVTYDLGEKCPQKSPQTSKNSQKTGQSPQKDTKKSDFSRFDESFLHVYTPKTSDKEKYLAQIESSRRKKLNFSYNSTNSPSKRLEFNLNGRDIDDEIEQISVLLNSSQFKNDKSEKLKQMVEYEDYLLSTGNNRINSASPTSIIRAKSAWMTSLVTPKKMSRKDPCTPTEKKMNRSASLRLDRSGSRGNKENSHFLGYDWIAGNVENQDLTFTHKNESFWEEMNHFRRAHSEECVATAAAVRPMLTNITAALNYDDLLPRAPTATRVPSPVHTCVYCYTLNDRLFAEPLCSDRNGATICPVCDAPKPTSSDSSPCFVQVTVPRKVLEDEDSPMIIPKRQPVASVSLRDHCALGLECSRPASLPTARDISLKNLAGRKENRIIRPDEVEKYILKCSSHLKAKPVEPRAKLTANFLRSMNRM